jgi:two-component system LytT family response regulator
MIRCFIIDDELASIKVLKRYIKRLPHLALLGYETNPMLGIATILREKPDLVFLDIHMEEMNGIDVMKIIGDQTKVVFCTAYSEYAVKSYELAAIDYLMKPIEFDRFLKAVQRVGNTLQSEDKAAGGADYIYVKWEGRGKFLKVDFNDIDYVQAKSNYVGIYGGARNILSYQTMKELEERLPEHKFMRIHKSYIVALDKIAEIDNNILILKSKVQLPISTNYKDIFLAKMRGRVVRDDK